MDLIFLPRAFNQDSLENYFGKIRKQRGRNVNPTCQQFTESYKTLLVQEIVASPRGGNCERTNLTNICSLKSLLDQPLTKNQTYINNQTEIINFNVVKQVSSLKEIYFRKTLYVNVISYISGWVAKKIKHLCSVCKSQIFQNHLNHSEVDALTYEKEFGGKIPHRLKYCNLLFINCINKTYKITKILLNHMNGTRGNRQFIIRFVKTQVSFPFSCVHKDNLTEAIICKVVDLGIFKYIRGINNIIKGRDSRRSKYNCELFNKAKKMYISRCKNKSV